VVLLRSSQQLTQTKINKYIMGMRNHTYTLEVERQTGGKSTHLSLREGKQEGFLGRSQCVESASNALAFNTGVSGMVLDEMFMTGLVGYPSETPE
jgi:hypothetical protein